MRDIRSFPSAVRKEIGYALYAAQHSELDPSAKPLKGFAGASVIEIVVNHRGDTWRTIYTIRFPEAVYVLHAFQKKSTRGVATRKADVDLVYRRLGIAEQLRREEKC